MAALPRSHYDRLGLQYKGDSTDAHLAHADLRIYTLRSVAVLVPMVEVIHAWLATPLLP